MNKRRTMVVFACFCTVLVASSIRYSYGTLLPDMLSFLSINKSQAGIIYSSYYIAYAVFSPILGFLSDRYNIIRIILSVFVALMGVGAFLMQYATSELTAVIFFTIAGIGGAACWVPVVVLAQRWVSEKRRGTVLAVVDVGNSLGGMAAGALVPLAVIYSGWKTGWMSLGIFAIVLGGVNFFMIRSYPEKRVKEARAQPEKIKGLDGDSVRQVLRKKRFWFIGIAYLLTSFSVTIPYTFLITYAVQELSFPYRSAAFLITIIGIGGIIGRLTLGPLSDKLGRIKVLALCAFLIGGGCFSMVYSRNWLFPMICFIFGIGEGACYSMYAACASDFFPKKTVGIIIGLWTFLLGIGSLAAPIIAGWVADVGRTLMWSFLIATASSITSMMLLLPMLKMPRYDMIKNR